MMTIEKGFQEFVFGDLQGCQSKAIMPQEVRAEPS